MVWEHKICTDQTEQITLAITVLKAFIENKTLFDIKEKYVDSTKIFNYVFTQYNFFLIKNKKTIVTKKLQTDIIFFIRVVSFK